MKKKRLTQNQSELVATFLPPKLQKNRKLSASVKLVLANIYQLYYYDNNRGKRTVFRTREDFMNDIKANDKNEVLRPHAVLMQNEMVIIKSGVRGRATEYTLNDELYNLLPSQVRGEVSDKFAESQKYNTLNTNDLQNEDTQVVSTLHNSLIDNEIQHSNVPSDSDTETDTDLEKELNIEKLDCIVHETEQSNQFNDEEIEEIFNNVDRDEQERLQNEWMHGSEQSNNINHYSTDFTEQNQWATSRIERLKSLIEVYRKCWKQPSMGYYEDDINATFNAIEKKIQLGWFTDSQINYFQSLLNNFNSIMKGKREWLEKQHSNESNIEDTEPPVLEYSGREYHFNDNVISYMDVLFMTQYMGHRRIDDWYKDDIDTLKVAINNLEDVRYRDYYNEFLRAEGF